MFFLSASEHGNTLASPQRNSRHSGNRAGRQFPRGLLFECPVLRVRHETMIFCVAPLESVGVQDDVHSPSCEVHCVLRGQGTFLS